MTAGRETSTPVPTILARHSLKKSRITSQTFFIQGVAESLQLWISFHETRSRSVVKFGADPSCRGVRTLLIFLDKKWNTNLFTDSLWKSRFFLFVFFPQTHILCIFSAHLGVFRTLAVFADFRRIPAVSTAEEHQEKSQDQGQRLRHAAGWRNSAAAAAAAAASYQLIRSLGPAHLILLPPPTDAALSFPLNDFNRHKEILWGL